eukprot:Gb_24181 [translate_table: standard]
MDDSTSLSTMIDRAFELARPKRTTKRMHWELVTLLTISIIGKGSNQKEQLYTRLGQQRNTHKGGKMRNAEDLGKTEEDIPMGGNGCNNAYLCTNKEETLNQSPTDDDKNSDEVVIFDGRTPGIMQGGDKHNPRIMNTIYHDETPLFFKMASNGSHIAHGSPFDGENGNNDNGSNGNSDNNNIYNNNQGHGQNGGGGFSRCRPLKQLSLPPDM